MTAGTLKVNVDIEINVDGKPVGRTLIKKLDRNTTEVGGDFLPIGIWSASVREVERIAYRKAWKKYSGRYTIQKSTSYSTER